MPGQVSKCEICDEPYNDYRGDFQKVCPQCKARADAKDNIKT